MSFISTNFTYNGISSEDMGVILVRVNTGLLERNFGIQKTINKEKLRHKDVPIYYNAEKQTYPIQITITKSDINDQVWTIEDRFRISQWLFADDQYHEFISEDTPDLIYSLQFTSGKFNDNFLNMGYVDLDAEMEYPYLLTTPSFSDYDLTDNTTTTIIEIENMTNVLEYYYPIFQFEATENTTLKIRNLTVGGEETIFSNLLANEKLCVDNGNQQIESSTGNERISNFNFVFLRLSKGLNRLEITGKGNLQFRCQFPVML